MKPGPFPPEVCSPVTLLKMCQSVLIPVNKCDKHHTQDVKAAITARERGGDQERLPKRGVHKTGGLQVDRIWTFRGYGKSIPARGNSMKKHTG